MIPSVAATPIRIVLVDDHALVLAGLRMLIESQPGLAVTGEASTPWRNPSCRSSMIDTVEKIAVNNTMSASVPG